MGDQPDTREELLAKLASPRFFEGIRARLMAGFGLTQYVAGDVTSDAIEWAWRYKAPMKPKVPEVTDAERETILDNLLHDLAVRDTTTEEEAATTNDRLAQLRPSRNVKIDRSMRWSIFQSL